MRNLLKLAYPCDIYFSKNPKMKLHLIQMVHQPGAYLFIYLFAMFIQAIQFSNAGLNGGLFTY